MNPNCQTFNRRKRPVKQQDTRVDFVGVGWGGVFRAGVSYPLQGAGVLGKYFHIADCGNVTTIFSKWTPFCAEHWSLVLVVEKFRRPAWTIGW